MRHLLERFDLSMRIQHVAHTAKGWPDATAGDCRTAADLTDTIERIRWRLWRGQVKRALDFIGETPITLDTTVAATGAKVACLLIWRIRAFRAFWPIWAVDREPDQDAAAALAVLVVADARKNEWSHVVGLGRSQALKAR
jgi:hypothetical protein